MNNEVSTMNPNQSTNEKDVYALLNELSETEQQILQNIIRLEKDYLDKEGSFTAAQLPDEFSKLIKKEYI